MEAWGTDATSTTANINWLVTDQLGTPRMIFDKTGALANVKRHDYLPFGEEIFAGTGGRVTTQGYSVADGVRQKFTSKERDNETGLDYFLARYYSSMQGRFTSPDEFSGGALELFNFAEKGSANPTFYSDLSNPQSLNKYQYCVNNPLRFIDPSGHEILFVYIGPAAGNAWGHAALKHVEEDTGCVTYIDVTGDKLRGEKVTVHRYTPEEFQKKYGARGIEEVHVDVPNEGATLLYIDRVEHKPWDFNFVTNNCDAFVTYAIEQGGGQITSDGSYGENPRKYPRDARDGFKKQNEQKNKEKKKENNKYSMYPGSTDLRSLMYSRLLENLGDFR